jgi:RIO kinase 1
MVKVWAEKEMRNYRRIYNAGIPCPAPVLLKSHVLIMEFLGENGWPSPRIRDANLSEKRLREAYVQTVVIMRRMFRRCKLVHGDLSEYNLLWHKNEVYVIDVSQSVESDHPSALDFLRKDVSNVNDFFRKMANLNVMTTRQLFDFVTSTVIEDTPEAESAALDVIMKCVDSNAMMMENATEHERRAQHQQESVDEAVFMSQFLPRSLNQVADYEVGKIEEGDVEETYAQAVAALTGNEDVVIAASKKASVHVSFKPADDDDEEEADSTSDCEPENDEIDGESKSDEESNDVEETDQSFKPGMTPEERAAAKEAEKALRKMNKKAAKEAQSEKRKNKIKKKDKQRAINKTKGNKKKK